MQDSWKIKEELERYQKKCATLMAPLEVSHDVMIPRTTEYIRAFNLKCNLLICAGTEKHTKDTLHFDEGQFSIMGIIRIGMISLVGLF